MGRQRRLHIKDQADKIAKLINVEPASIKADSKGVVPTPEQLDKLLTLLEEKKAKTKIRV